MRAGNRRGRLLVKQNGLTVITEIDSGREAALRSVLANAGALIPFDSIVSLHYAAFVILPEVDDHPPRLVLETNYDGKMGDHLEQLITQGAEGLDQIYRACRGYPAGGAQRSRDEAKRYFLCNSIPSSAFYVAFPGRSRDDIRNAIAVYQTAKDFLDAQSAAPGFRDLTRDQIWKRLVDHFRTLPESDQPLPSPVTQRRLKWRIAFNLVVFGLPLLAIALVALPVLFLITRYFERKEARDVTPPRYKTDPLAAYQKLNLGRQNHMCTLATVKVSWFRAVMVRLCLGLVHLLASKIFILGNLDTMTTIHFARWALFDNNRRVLFLSNFDGTWSSYIGDFSDPPHLNAVWSNTERFPPTYFLLWRGARDLARFNDHVVEEFQPTCFFYPPYDHSVENILRYLNFRDALARAI